MLYEIIERQLKKTFFVVSYDRYLKESSTTSLERFALKHTLLKPELIVVNEQPFGFKKASKTHSQLERFPIFCEVESRTMEEERCVDSFDLYAEAQCDFQSKLADIVRLSTLYSRTVAVERVKHINTQDPHVLLIYSKLTEFIQDYESDNSNMSLLSEAELESYVQFYMTSFSNFLKNLNEKIDVPADVKDNNSTRFL